MEKWIYKLVSYTLDYDCTSNLAWFNTWKSTGGREGRARDWFPSPWKPPEDNRSKQCHNVYLHDVTIPHSAGSQLITILLKERKIGCSIHHCPACRTSLIATRFWVVVICLIIKCLTVLEFSFLLFDLCLFITIFNFILNYVPIVTFWIFTYHKIWILLIIFCFIWNYWIIYFLTCLEVFWSVVS